MNRAPHPSRRLAAAALVALATCAACGRAGEPRWIELARGFHPVPLEPAARRWAARLPDGVVATVHDLAPGRARVEATVALDALQPAAGPGRQGWARVASPVPYAGADVRVRLGDAVLERRPSPAGGPGERGAFALAAGELHVALPPGRPGASDEIRTLTVEAALALGDEVDGTWRVAAADREGAGFLLAPGFPVQLATELPAASALSFFTVARVRGQGEGRVDAGPVRVRVLLDGRVLAGFEQPTVPGAPGRWRSVQLPAAGAASARLAFEVEGPAAECAVLAPTIGPADRAAARERSRERPDLVLFLADTFRADNLALWRGAPGPAPGLDRRIERGRAFARAWAPASWTLPSQASMLCGLYPPEHGATRHGRALGPGATTIAEILARRGYRTGAVTDAGYVSARCGLAQGFTWWEEHRDRDLGATLASARAFLEAGDGRPSLLFVQTYRAHHPYRSGPEEDTAGWDAFFARHADHFDLPVLRMRSVDDWGGERPEGRMREAVDELRGLYEAGVGDLDGLVAPWLDGLERDGLLSNAALVLASDHGEAFAEHGELWHGGAMWDELLRVPLVVWSPRFPPGVDERPVTLVDLPRTLAELAGVAPDPGWGGASLLDPPATRTLYAFGEGPHKETVVLLEDPRKVMALADPDALAAGAFRRAFDLSADPREERDLGAGGSTGSIGAAWPAELCRARAEEVRALLELRLAPASLTGTEDLGDLQDLGYAAGG